MEAMLIKSWNNYANKEVDGLNWVAYLSDDVEEEIFLVEYNSHDNVDAFFDMSHNGERLLRDRDSQASSSNLVVFELRMAYQFKIVDDKVHWATYDGNEIDATALEFHDFDDFERYTFNTLE